MMHAHISVAFIFHDTDYYSGATRSLMDLIYNLDRSKINIYAIVPHKEGSLINNLNEHNIKIIYSPYHGNTYYLSENKFQRVLKCPKRYLFCWLNIVYGIYLAQVATKQNIDIVYTNTGTLYVGAIMKRFRKQIKHIWHIREYVEEDHNLGILGGRTKFYKILNRYTNDVILISQAVAEKYRLYIYGPQVHIIYDDVSVQYVQNKFDKYQSYTPLNILICGNICPNKGQIQAIKAIHQLILKDIPVHLFIAGGITDQKYYTDINQYISQNHLEKYISIMGKVRNMNAVRRKTKYSIIASKSEAFGRATIESMLSGHYVIGARAAGTKELIQDGITGRLYDYEKIDELADILIQAYNDGIKVNQICQKGYEYAIKFTEGRCAKMIEKIILE